MNLGWFGKRLNIRPGVFRLFFSVRASAYEYLLMILKLAQHSSLHIEE